MNPRISFLAIAVIVLAPLVGVGAMGCHSFFGGVVPYAGFLVFLARVMFPFWYGKGRAVTPLALPLDPSEIQTLAVVKECVEPAPFMRTIHMELLNSWREPDR